LKHFLKWIVIIGGGMVLLVCGVLLLVPLFVDMEQYKPEIENWFSDKTGRPCAVNGELNLSLFPWVGLSFENLSIGNPAGFEESEFISIKVFDASVKLFPLLFKDIQVKHVIARSPRLVLITQKDGRVNWKGPSEESKTDLRVKTMPGEQTGKGISLKSLEVGEFSVSDGSVIIIDHRKESRREFSDITVQLNDISLHHPIHMYIAVKIDNMPVSLEGNIGPLGEEIGRGDIPVDLSLNAHNQLNVGLTGKVSDLADKFRFNLALQTEVFSPKKLISALNKGFTVSTADSNALTKMSVKTVLEGGPDAIFLTNGNIILDDSSLQFIVKVKAFHKPDLFFDMQLDQIDLDRYLPSKTTGEVPSTKSPASPVEKMDYTPFRSLVLNGNIRVEKLKINNAKIQNLALKVSGNKGVFHIDPLSFEMYKGKVSANAAMNMETNTPRTTFKLKGNEIQASPLLKDVLGKDILEGELIVDIDVQTTGDNPDKMKRTLSGSGDLLFKDGAIKGVDLTAMARNVNIVFGMEEAGEERPRTDFSEFHCPLVIKKGIINTTATKLVSPMIRVEASGQADIVKEILDFRVKPTFVATLKGKGDAQKRSGFMVPILVTGSFSSPKFAPDLDAVIKQGLEGAIPEPSDLKKIFDIGGASPEDSESLEKRAKELFKELPFGR